MRLLRRSMGTTHAAAAFSSRYPQKDEIDPQKDEIAARFDDDQGALKSA
jgi:hypothetical protein